VKTRLARLIIVASGLAAILVPLSARSALAALPTPASGTTWDQNQDVEYRWKEGSEPPSWAKTPMNAAASDSNSSRRSKAATFHYDANGASWLAYTDDLPTNWAIGYTVRNIPASFNIRMRPHGTPLDWGVLKWCEFYGSDAPSGCYDLEMVTLHEFGHAQTLSHVDEADIDAYTDSLMHATGLHSKSKIGWNQHVFGRCDVARLQIRYEPQNSSTDISDCLSMDTTLSLTPAATSVVYGGNLGFTAKLKIDPGEVYPMLAGWPLSGRTVVLQRRTPGTTSWTNVTNLTSVTDEPGKYVKTITLTATYEWRALFNSPSAEGLKGTSSSVTKVSVGYGCTPNGQGTSNFVPLYETC
jgi:hypothetical protein